jgi:hypothetical protein
MNNTQFTLLVVVIGAMGAALGAGVAMSDRPASEARTTVPVKSTGIVWEKIVPSDANTYTLWRTSKPDENGVMCYQSHGHLWCTIVNPK